MSISTRAESTTSPSPRSRAAATTRFGGGLRDVVLADVEHQQERLQREERVARDRLALFGRELELADRLLGFERVLEPLEQRQLDLRGRVLRDLLHARLDDLEVGEDRLGREAGDLAERIGRLARRVRERAHHLAERVERAHRVQHAAVEPFAVTAREIGERDLGVGLLLRLEQLRRARRRARRAPSPRRGAPCRPRRPRRPRGR